jgi:hypothetical protein
LKLARPSAQAAASQRPEEPRAESLARLACLIGAHTPYDGSFPLRVPGVDAIRRSSVSRDMVRATVRDCMPALFDLLVAEVDPVVRAASGLLDRQDPHRRRRAVSSGPNAPAPRRGYAAVPVVTPGRTCRASKAMVWRATSETARRPTQSAIDSIDMAAPVASHPRRHSAP